MGNHVGLQIPLPSPKEMLPLLAEKDGIDTTSAKRWGGGACLPPTMSVYVCHFLSLRSLIILALNDLVNYPGIFKRQVSTSSL